MKNDSTTEDFKNKIHEAKELSYETTKHMTAEQKKEFYKKAAADFDAELEKLKLKHHK